MNSPSPSHTAKSMRILVVDDEPALRDSLSRALRFEGYTVTVARDGHEALARRREDAPDLMILDVMMPGITGIEVCRRLRAGGDGIPVLMLTARDAVGDRVSGLDAGADDYVPKPFALEELLARVRALHRRRSAAADAAGGDAPLRFDTLTLDPLGYDVTRGDRRLELTRTEFSLLELFLRHPRQVLTRTQIFERVWGYDFGSSSNSLDVYVGYLRRKLEEGGETRLVQTVRGVGYVLRVDP